MIKDILKNKKALKIFKIIISIIFLIVVLVKVDFSIILQASYLPLFFFLAIINSLLILVLQAIRWNIVLKNIYKYDLELKKSFNIVSIGHFFSFITPSRVGDVFKAKYIAEDLGKLKSVSSVLVDRIVEFGVLLLMAFIGLMYFSSRIFDVLVLEIGAAIIILIGVILACFIAFLLVKKYFRDFYNRVVFEIKTILNNKRTIIITALISVLVWVLSFAQMYLAALTLGITVSFVEMVLVTAVITVIMLLPITIAGVGLRELTGTTILTIIGVTASQGLLIVWIVLVTLTLFPAVLGYIFYLTNKKKMPKESISSSV